MFSISSCPHCGQQVLISAELSPECLVRCLICEAEFPLSQALANAVDAPPELVPVARVTEPPGGTGWGAVPSSRPESVVAGLPTEPHPDEGGSQVVGRGDSPSTPEEHREAGAAPQPTKLEPAAESEAGGPHDIYALAGSAGADKWPDAQPNAVPAVSHSEAAALWRSHQRPVSSLGSAGKAIAIVVGGLFGIAVAYLALSIVSPRRFDFLHLWGRSTQEDITVKDRGSKGSRPAGQGPGKSAPDNPSFSDLEGNHSSSRAKKP